MCCAYANDEPRKRPLWVFILVSALKPILFRYAYRLRAIYFWTTLRYLIRDRAYSMWWGFGCNGFSMRMRDWYSCRNSLRLEDCARGSRACQLAVSLSILLFNIVFLHAAWNGGISPSDKLRRRSSFCVWLRMSCYDTAALWHVCAFFFTKWQNVVQSLDGYRSQKQATEKNFPLKSYTCRTHTV